MKRKRNEEQDNQNSNRTENNRKSNNYLKSINKNNINDIIKELGSPLLHYTIKSKSNKVTAKLLLMGARLDVQDEDGKTLFDIVKELPLTQQKAESFRIGKSHKKDVEYIILQKLFTACTGQHNTAETAQRNFEILRQQLLLENQGNIELKNLNVFDQDTNASGYIDDAELIKSTQVEKNNDSIQTVTDSIDQLNRELLSSLQSNVPNPNQYSHNSNFKVSQNAHINSPIVTNTSNNIPNHTFNKPGFVINNQTITTDVYSNEAQKLDIYRDQLHTCIIQDDLPNAKDLLQRFPQLFLSKNSQNISILEIAINTNSPVLSLIQVLPDEELKKCFYSRDSKHRTPIAAAIIKNNSEFIDFFLNIVIERGIIDEKKLGHALIGNIVPITDNPINSRSLLLAITIKCEPFIIRNILEIKPTFFNNLIFELFAFKDKEDVINSRFVTILKNTGKTVQHAINITKDEQSRKAIIDITSKYPNLFSGIMDSAKQNNISNSNSNVNKQLTNLVIGTNNKDDFLLSMMMYQQMQHTL